jgi:hypothetical protein
LKVYLKSSIITTLILCAALLIPSFAMAGDIAISKHAGWYSQDAADREMDEVVANVSGVSIEVFTPDEAAWNDLAAWVQNHTGNGELDMLILNGQFPNTIYGPGNTQADNSLGEMFLDDGNIILNTGDYMFYVVDGAGTNGEGGLQTMMDLATTMWDDDTPVLVTAEGSRLCPTLQDFSTDRPFHLDELTDGWEAEVILAQNDAGTRADPAVIKNVNTDGRLIIFYQTASQDDDPRGEVISEFIENWYKPLIATPESPGTSVEPTDKMASTWAEIKSR